MKLSEILQAFSEINRCVGDKDPEVLIDPSIPGGSFQDVAQIDYDVEKGRIYIRAVTEEFL